MGDILDRLKLLDCYCSDGFTCAKCAARDEIERLTECCAGYKGQVEAGAAVIDRLRKVLAGLAKRHEGYEQACGPCLCEWRQEARAIASVKCTPESGSQ